jgi:predicted TIM-barrel fold metal-dependent hydrolase
LIYRSVVSTSLSTPDTAAAAPPIACISADSHVTEPGDAYIDRIDPAFRDRAPRLIDHEQLGAVMLIDNGQSMVPLWLVAGAGRPAEQLGFKGKHAFEELWPGGYDPAARLEEQDVDGVLAEVIYPSVGMVLCNHPDREYQHACYEAYNRWIAEFCAHAPERLIGVGQTALRTPEEGVADLEAMHALGLRGVMVPGNPATEYDYDDPRYGPFWDACVDLGIPPSFHILTARDSGSLLGSGVRGPRINAFMSVIRANQDIMGMLVFGGVFERHPRLRVVCVEADAGWVPHFAYRMDHAYDRHRYWLPSGQISKMPSEYFNEHVYVTFQDDWVAFKIADLVNAERLMWANDHPHSDATWPWSQKLLAEHTATLRPEQARRIVHDNAAELYHLNV